MIGFGHTSDQPPITFDTPMKIALGTNLIANYFDPYLDYKVQIDLRS